MAEPDLKKTPLFDAHVASGARMVPFSGWSMPVQYPADESSLPPDEYALQMFRMSSVFPDPVLEMAGSMGLPVTEGSRGYVYNADMVALVQFLDIGTRAATDLH